MTETKGTFAVAVLGAMNPSIHVPDWYHYLNLISEDEVAQAKKDGPFFCTPVAAQFSLGTLSVNCTQSKWIARGADSESDRVTEIACATFATLEHTPVSAYGVNFGYHVNSGTDAGALLGTRVGSTLGLEQSEIAALAAGSLTYRQALDARTVNVTIEPASSGPDWLSVGFNYHYDVDSAEWQHFDLAGLLRSAVSKDSQDAPTRLQRTLKVLVNNAETS